MVDSKNKVNLIFIRNSFGLVLSLIVSLSISIKQSNALPHEWVRFLKVNMENSYGIDKVLKEMRMVL